MIDKKNSGIVNEIEADKMKIQLLTSEQNYLSANAALYEAVIRFFKSIGVVS